MKYYNKLFMVLLLIAGLVFATGCVTDTSITGDVTDETSIEEELDPIKLGVMLPLTGEAASWGENGLAGITLATNEINALGGIDGRQIEMYVEDDQCSSASVSAIQTLINVDDVNVIVGPVCSAASGPALPVAVADGIPIMLIAASAPDLTSYGDNVFRVYPSDAFQGSVAAEFVIEEEGHENIAIVYVKNDWGEGIYNVFREEALALGANIVYESGTLEDEVDFKTEITKLQSMDVDAIYLPLHPNGGVAFFKQMEDQGLDIPIYGGDAFSGSETYASGYGNGVKFSVPKGEWNDAFEDDIHSLSGFSDLDLSIAAPLGYDAAMVMFEAIDEAESLSYSSIISSLFDISMPGVFSELIEFDEIGDIIGAEYEWYMIQDGETILVS